MRDIVLQFPGVLANDHVDFTLKHGEIHALLGENGAGKSTLMNVLAGMYKPNAGTIAINGEQVVFNSPKDAIAKGIGMVHQHFMLVPTQTVTENILLGLDEPRFFMSLPKYDQKVQALADKFGLRVEPTAKIWQLSVGEQQRVEILKILYRGADILIMDEPTAALGPAETAQVRDLITQLKAEGIGIFLISHDIHDVFDLADRISVMLQGKLVGTVNKNDVTKDEVLAMIIAGKQPGESTKHELAALHD